MADQNNENIKVNRELAEHNARIETLEAEIKSMAKDVREIRDTITGAKGSWKMLMAIVGLLSGALIMLVNKLWALIFSDRVN